ncbi:SRPBCC family protein [Pontimicrobium sp. MEBiC01747]
MKYTSEIIVKVSLDDFIKKLDNHDNMKHWQRGLTSYEHLSGNPGKTGAKMQLNYTFGKRKMSLTETIVDIKLPHKMYLNYDAPGMHNIQKNSFSETADGHTKWVSKSEFIATNFKMRMLTLLMPSIFKKQSMKYLTDFKNFAENGISVLDA